MVKMTVLLSTWNVKTNVWNTKALVKHDDVKHFENLSFFENSYRLKTAKYVRNKTQS